MVITSIQNPKIKELAKLKEKKYRDECKKYLIEGIHLVEMAKDYLLEILVVNEDYLENYSFLKNVPTTIVSEEVIKKLAFTKSPQPIIGVCKYFKNKVLLNNRVLLLDNLQDPGNIGTILRSALAFNVNEVVMSKDTVDIYNDKVIRASQFEIYKLNIVYQDLKVTIETLKKNNIKVFGTSLDNGTNLRNIEKVSKYGLILGNEGNGVSKELLKITDKNIFIEMEDKIVFLDQHAAHERITYTALQKAVSMNNGLSQELITPLLIRLSPTEAATLEENSEKFKKSGFVIDMFDESSATLRAIPALGLETNWEKVIKEMLGELSSYSDSFELEKFFLSHLAQKACKASVRRNDVLAEEEIDVLIDAVNKSDFLSCPHGRPFFFVITRNEFEKKVQRR